ERHELPVHPGAEDVAGLDVQIARATLDRGLDDLLDPGTAGLGRHLTPSVGGGSPSGPAPPSTSRARASAPSPPPPRAPHRPALDPPGARRHGRGSGRAPAPCCRRGPSCSRCTPTPPHGTSSPPR